MTDQTLLVFGCAVSFIALAGSYVYVRASLERGARERARPAAPRPEGRAPAARPEVGGVS